MPILILSNSEMMMHYFNSKDQIYDEVNCHFVICQKCFWTATIFSTAARKGNNRNMSACPICSCENISTFSILVHENNNYTNE